MGKKCELTFHKRGFSKWWINVKSTQPQWSSGSANYNQCFRRRSLQIKTTDGRKDGQEQSQEASHVAGGKATQAPEQVAWQLSQKDAAETNTMSTSTRVKALITAKRPSCTWSSSCGHCRQQNTTQPPRGHSCSTQRGQRRAQVWEGHLHPWGQGRRCHHGERWLAEGQGSHLWHRSQWHLPPGAITPGLKCVLKSAAVLVTSQ